MSSDLSEFLDVFFEECFEGLAIMESGLIALDSENANSEEINTIFRAAHSIKGGAATFEMNAVADFTHVMETLLDEMRDGRRAVSRPAVDLLLASLDGLTSMITALRSEQPIDEARVAALKSQLDAMLASSDSGKPPEVDETAACARDANAAPDVSGKASPSRWEILFEPGVDLLTTGNDPQHLFRALEELGPLTVHANTEAITGLDGLDPQKCYLSWQLVLESAASEDEIREVFAWVEDECALLIANTSPVSESPAPVPSAPTAASTGTLAAQAGDTEVSLDPLIVDPSITKAVADDKPSPPASIEQAKNKSGGGEGSSIRVGIDKVDELINLVGELVITRSMLSRFADGINDDELEIFRGGLTALARNTRELQEAAMQIRMLPISSCFNRFPRLVRDMSAKLGKQIELEISGGGTELDKTVLEKINDPLVHLVRNSMDHGIEMPEERAAAGKPENGLIHLHAFHKGSSIVIEVRDDGAGLNTEKLRIKALERGLITADAELSDEQINNLIFHAGFSTADEVSDLSGRGVGMDVVKRNIQDLGGAVSVKSVRGEGSTLTIRLPLTMAILDGQLLRVGDQIYIISLVSIVESLQVSPDRVNVVPGGSEIYKLRDEFIPVVRLHELFNTTPSSTALEDGLLVVVEAEGSRVGVFIDDLLDQQQVVIKSLESNFRQVDCLSGATILGDGAVALILDVPGLVQRSRSNDARGKSRREAA